MNQSKLDLTHRRATSAHFADYALGHCCRRGVLITADDSSQPVISDIN